MEIPSDALAIMWPLRKEGYYWRIPIKRLNDHHMLSTNIEEINSIVYVANGFLYYACCSIVMISSGP
jgi:hypothetical protein